MCLLKPSKDISHDPATGAMKIQTITTFRNFNMDFTIGEEFTEDLGPVDGRSCQVCVADLLCLLYTLADQENSEFHCCTSLFNLEGGKKRIWNVHRKLTNLLL